MEILNEAIPHSPSRLQAHGWPKINSHRLVSSETHGNWEYTVVCTVNKPVVNWFSVGLQLKTIFQVTEEIELIPFNKKQAIIHAYTAEDRDYICKGTKLLDEGDEISLIPWMPEANAIQHQSANGGWIGIDGLPFHLWTLGMFTSIANCFGGLDCLDEDTKLCTDLTMARIKLKGDLGRVPSFMLVEEGAKEYFISLKLIPEPTKTQSNPVTVPEPELCFFPLAVGRDEDDADSATPSQVAGSSTRGAIPNHHVGSPTRRHLTIFGTPVGDGAFSNSNLNSNNCGKEGNARNWSPPREVRQGLCSNPTFKRRHNKRLTSIWLQKRCNADIADVSESTYISSSLYEEEPSVTASSSMDSTENTLEIVSETNLESSSPSSLPNLPQHSIDSACAENPVSEASSERTIDDVITITKDDKLYTLPLLETFNNFSTVVEQTAKFAGIFGIQIQGDHWQYWESLIRRDIGTNLNLTSH